jgi:hypothetical protein
VDPHQTEQDNVLRELVKADAAEIDEFATATDRDEMTVFHSGLRSDGQATYHRSLIRGLIQRGLLEVTSNGGSDFWFAITRQGREYVERLDRGGLSALEEALKRADDADAMVTKLEQDAADAKLEDDNRRKGRASRLAKPLAWLAAASVGVGLFVLNEDPTYRVVITLIGFLGIAGASFLDPVHKLLTGWIYEALRAIHNAT